MKTKHIIFLFIIIVFFGCRRSCPDDFPIDVRYFPYSEGSKISFWNTHGDTLIATVQYISNKKDKHIPLGCKCYCEYIYDFALNGDIQLNGSITGLANPNNSHYFTISLSIEIKYNDFGNYYIESKDIEGNNYDVFGDTILLYDDQKCATIIKGKGIKEWTDGDGEVWKLIE